MGAGIKWQLLCLVATAMLWGRNTSAAEPRVLIKGARLERIAAEPEIVTPVGMTFDSQGRLLVIESHTHQRPDDYRGPTGDRILMLSASERDGRLDTWSVFADGFRQSMNLLAAGPGRVYLVTRRSVDLLIDDDQDGKLDRQEPVLRLETEVDYPHNALSGIAHDGEGGLLVGLGENFGGKYKLVGSDGKSYSDQGGVGTLFHCTADGKDLRRFCHGFWNPFSICVLPGGQVFTVDNDPDSSPPCRLIHAVESGDYGHRWEYSRAGTHPLQAWDGELPGTLPMVAGTGEAPCAVVPHRGFLWVTSWGDHRLERYQLKPQGASFAAEQKIAVQGDSEFRPTGCAVAPDGSLYFADWVDHSYPVHGKGRIWRLSFGEGSERQERTFTGIDRDKKTSLPHGDVNSEDPFERQRVVRAWAKEMDLPLFLENLARADSVQSAPSRQRLALAQAYRWSQKPVSEEMFRTLLNDEDSSVRLYAVRWIADERVQSMRDELAALLDGGMDGGGFRSGNDIPDERYYLAVLSALEWLDGKRELRQASLNDELLVRELENEKRSPKLHALALRLVSPDNRYLTLEKLGEFLRADYQPLKLEAVRTLALQSNPARFGLLAEVAKNSAHSDAVRAEAVAAFAATEQQQEFLAALAEDGNKTIRKEAQRVQRLIGARPVKPEEKPSATDLAGWNQLLAGQGDAAAGRRLFFSARGARCGVCHQHGGRGGQIGPDLSRIRVSNSREQILASILQPSREMAPHYQPWTLQTDAGKTLVGLRLHESGDGGKEVYADSNGLVFQLASDEIEVRQASDLSIMPAGLEKTVSIDELRDLLEFLSSGPSE